MSADEQARTLEAFTASPETDRLILRFLEIISTSR